MTVLAEILADLPPIAVALSGGIDSRFLCHAALLRGADVLAVHASGPHIPAAETAWAIAWAKKRGLPLKVIRFDPLASPEVAGNGKERCYHCKKGLVSAISARLAEDSEDHRRICDGSNLDDQKTYRPGMAALAEAGVLSPLAEAGFDKEKIRRMAAETGLAYPGQPSRPCLLTRFAYGMTVTPLYLALAGKLEEQIKTALSVLPRPPDFRLRFRPNPVLHLTAPIPGRKLTLKELLTRNGLPDCAIEVVENLSGYFDRPESQNTEKNNGST